MKIMQNACFNYSQSQEGGFSYPPSFADRNVRAPLAKNAKPQEGGLCVEHIVETQRGVGLAGIASSTADRNRMVSTCVVPGVSRPAIENRCSMNMLADSPSLTSSSQ